MTEVKIQVDGAHARMAEKVGRLTTGMVGAVARFSFDGVWDGLTKVAVFKGSGVTRDVLRWDGDAVKIPAEVLREEGDLFVGVEGHNADGSLVIPTVWTDRINVLCGANASGDLSVDPGLPVWAQIDSKMGDLAQLQTKAKESLVDAINEVLRSGGGSVDEATVERIVEAYLADNPPEGGAPGEDGLTRNEKNLILALFKNAVYTADMSATIAQLETLWSGSGEDSGGNASGVSQVGSVLIITSDVTVTQSGSVLAIA